MLSLVCCHVDARVFVGEMINVRVISRLRAIKEK